MAHYIDKDALDTVLRKLWKKDNGLSNAARDAYNGALQDIQCEIDTLEVKEVDLEEEIESSMNNLCEPGCYIQLLLENPGDYERFAKPFTK